MKTGGCACRFEDDGQYPRKCSNFMTYKEVFANLGHSYSIVSFSAIILCFIVFVLKTNEGFLKPSWLDWKITLYILSLNAMNNINFSVENFLWWDTLLRCQFNKLGTVLWWILCCWHIHIISIFHSIASKWTTAHNHSKPTQTQAICCLHSIRYIL